MIFYQNIIHSTIVVEFNIADESRTPIACQRILSAISAFFVLMGVSPPAPKKAENTSKNTADRCFAVLGEMIFVQARQRPQRILTVLSRALTQLGRKSARQNRQVFGSRQLKSIRNPLTALSAAAGTL